MELVALGGGLDLCEETAELVVRIREGYVCDL
jgi:hypothetical protein